MNTNGKQQQEQELLALARVLEHNISCLYNTAKGEMARREDMLRRLRSQLDREQSRR